MIENVVESDVHKYIAFHPVGDPTGRIFMGRFIKWPYLHACEGRYPCKV